MSWDKNKDVFALMVGHGKSIDGSWDSGCVYGRYTEASLMLNIVKVAVKYLRNSGVKVLTDADKHNNRNMISCVQWANYKRAKYYMSVHCDYKLAPAGVAPLYVSAKGKDMADTIGKSIAQNLSMKWRGSFKRPDLYELSQTNMVSVILETGAIKADLTNLKDHTKYGIALANAICKFIGVKFDAKITKTIADITFPKRGYFTIGDKGSSVVLIKKFLNKYAKGGLKTSDDTYDKATKAAVKRWQKSMGIDADGLFGEESLRAARSVIK